MTRLQTFKAIRALGMAVQYRDGEWKINYKYPLTHYREETAYYTTDAEDALLTATEMAKHKPEGTI